MQEEWKPYLEKIQATLAEIMTQDGLKRYMDILIRNPTLQMFEALSIYIQRPEEGKLLHTYNEWKSAGRNVKPDEKSIWVLQYPEPDEEDDEEESVPNIHKVFDITQTVGKKVEKRILEEIKISSGAAEKKFDVLLKNEILIFRNEMGLLPEDTASTEELLEYALKSHFGIMCPLKPLKDKFSNAPEMASFLSFLSDYLSQIWFRMESEKIWEQILELSLIVETEKVEPQREAGQETANQTEADGRKCPEKRVNSVIRKKPILKKSQRRMSLLARLEQMKKVVEMRQEQK